MKGTIGRTTVPTMKGQHRTTAISYCGFPYSKGKWLQILLKAQGIWSETFTGKGYVGRSKME